VAALLLYAPDMSRAVGFEEIRDVEMNKLVRGLLLRRTRFSPLGIALVAAFMWTETLAWRRNSLIIMIVAFTCGQLLTLREYLRGAPSVRVVGLNTVAMSFGMLAVVALTGGADSPVAPTLMFFCNILPLVLSPWSAGIAAGIVCAGLLLLTAAQALGWYTHAVPTLFGGGAYVGSRTLLLTRGVGFALFSLVSFIVNLRVRQALDEIGRRSIRTRDEALADHAEQMRTLTTVAGEIAHELKNPLASIKGLASLVARDLHGKNAEHMVVLRREVDRMQSVLEEFLNFSRPLVPLSLTEVDLDELCADVLRLHESVAATRGVRLMLEADPGARVRGDRRKLKQILINLVQNALDASPPDAPLRVVVDRGGDKSLRLRVIDRGPGVAPEVAARIFDAGVTTKPNGSGLGLTLSRLLARQHGGELALSSSAVGCTAELTLPEEVWA
jgi:signal transduction histidine kinase